MHNYSIFQAGPCADYCNSRQNLQPPCNRPIRDPEDPHTLIATPEQLPEDVRYAKERALLELVNAERAQGRRVFVYAVYAERHDVVGRLTKILPLYGSE